MLTSPCIQCSGHPSRATQCPVHHAQATAGGVRAAAGEDLSAGLLATRDIGENEPITFDYDTTEDDLRGDRGGFECHCGAANCRGVVLGSLYSPAPPTKAPSKAAA